MRALKSLFGVIGALIPVCYCGYLLYYFIDVTGSVQEAEKDGLGPTLLGLAIVGLLLCIPLLVKIVRLVAGSGSGGRGGPDLAAYDGESGFDADAAVTRYMARRSAEAVPDSAPAPAARERDLHARSPSFGRKNR